MSGFAWPSPVAMFGPAHGPSGRPIDLGRLRRCLLDATAALMESEAVNPAPVSTPIPDHASHVDALDRADVRASLNGDSGAYARIVARHQEALASRMRRFTRGPAAVEELVQEVFVQAYFALPGYRGTAPFGHWLARIATRVGYRAWRRRDAQPAAALAEWDGPDPRGSADAAHAAEAADELHSLLEALPPRDRLVLTLLYLEERSVAEAASLAGWTRAMVKVQAFRARGKLKRLIESRESTRNRFPRATS